MCMLNKELLECFCLCVIYHTFTVHTAAVNICDKCGWGMENLFVTLWQGTRHHEPSQTFYLASDLKLLRFQAVTQQAPIQAPVVKLPITGKINQQVASSSCKCMYGPCPGSVHC